MAQELAKGSSIVSINPRVGDFDHGDIELRSTYNATHHGNLIGSFNQT
jgi:hypothetical protein